MRLKLKFWLEEDGNVLFGDGRLQLLKAVAETGSLAGAARELNMSYRAAWGRIKASEERMGCSLVERSEAGRRAVQLTPLAIELIESFEALRAASEEFLLEAGMPLMKKMQEACGQNQGEES